MNLETFHLGISFERHPVAMEHSLSSTSIEFLSRDAFFISKASHKQLL